MTQQPKDDQDFANFLRQHRPVPPPAQPDLEERLMSAIAQVEPDLKVSGKPLLNGYRSLWLVPPAIAAGLLSYWAGERVLLPTKPSSAQLARLEVFMETSWDSVLRDRESEWVFPVEAIATSDLKTTQKSLTTNQPQ